MTGFSQPGVSQTGLAKQSWQHALSDLITDPEELLTLLELDPALLAAARAAAQLFPLKVPRRYVMRMQKGNPHDPLLRQVLPLEAELVPVAGYVSDPLQEARFNPVPGLLHKYHDRVLVTLTSACAIHCRYCFRRHFPYNENNPGRQGWEAIYAYIQQDSTINEVILSGGDPLTVGDKILASFSEGLHLIPHIDRLRLHTRVPVVLPERVTADFLNWIHSLKMKLIIVVHANHPNEIDHEVKEAFSVLRNQGVTMLNQSVLLQGINDDAPTLIALSKALFAAGVLPYYLHVLDKVKGAAHFDIARKRALDLHQNMSQQLPGYLVPKLVCEEPGHDAKMLLYP